MLDVHKLRVLDQKDLSRRRPFVVADPVAPETGVLSTVFHPDLTILQTLDQALG